MGDSTYDLVALILDARDRERWEHVLEIRSQIARAADALREGNLVVTVAELERKSGISAIRIVNELDASPGLDEYVNAKRLIPFQRLKRELIVTSLKLKAAGFRITLKVLSAEIKKQGVAVEAGALQKRLRPYPHLRKQLGLRVRE